MALFDGEFGILFELQPVEGVLAPGLLAIVGAPGGPYTEADGLVLGDPESGVGDSGISFTAGRNAREKGTVAGSFTRLFDDLLNGTVETFTFAFPMAGNRSTPGPAGIDGDFRVALGIEAIFGGTGLGGGAGWAGGLGWEYTPANTTFVSALIFDSGTVYALIDMQGNLSVDATPGQAAIATATFTAKVDLPNSGGVFAFPVLNYGAQQSESAPSISEVANTFGQTRGFSAFTLGIDNQVENVPDSNALDGERIEQAGREVSVSMTIDADDGDPTFDWDNLTAETAQTDDLSFLAGTVNADDGTDPAEAFQVECNNINEQSLALARPARAKANTVDGFCTSTVDGGELSLIFL